MKYAAYHDAAHPEPRIVLGRLLRPYSLGHVQLLHAAQSNFIYGGELGWEDLGISILICERDFEAGAEMLWRIRSDVKFARQHVRRMFKWGKRLPSTDLTAACLSFAEYVNAGSHTINIRYQEPSSEVRNEAPEHQLVKCHFLFNSTLSESEIMNRPWGLARSEWMTHLAMQGLATIEGEDGENLSRAEIEADAECITSAVLDGAKSCGEVVERMRQAMDARRASKGGQPCDN